MLCIAIGIVIDQRIIFGKTFGFQDVQDVFADITSTLFSGGMEAHAQSSTLLNSLIVTEIQSRY